EPLLPDAPLPRDPMRHALQANGFEAHRAHTTPLLGHDEAALLQYPEEIEERRKGHDERLRKLAHGGRALPQTLDDGAARGVRKRVEGGIEGRGSHRRRERLPCEDS